VGNVGEKDFIISCKFDQQDSNSVIGEKTAVSTDFFDNTYKQLFSAVSSTLLAGSYRVIPLIMKVQIIVLDN
jgi:hypothetical protein